MGTGWSSSTRPARPCLRPLGPGPLVMQLPGFLSCRTVGSISPPPLDGSPFWKMVGWTLRLPAEPPRPQFPHLEHAPRQSS